MFSKGLLALLAPLLAFFQAQPSAGLQEHKITNMFNPLTTPARVEFNMAMLEFAITGAIFVVVAGSTRLHDDSLPATPERRFASGAAADLWQQSN